MESALLAGSWCFQHQCIQGMFKQNKGNQDGLLYGLSPRLPGGFSGWWGHTRWVMIWYDKLYLDASKRWWVASVICNTEPKKWVMKKRGRFRCGSESEGVMDGDCWVDKVGCWFQRQCEAYQKERSVIHFEDDVGGQARMMTDEEQVLQGGWMEMSLCRYGGWAVVRTL